LVIHYLNSFEDIDISTRQTIHNYLQFISERAKGILTFYINIEKTFEIGKKKKISNLK